MSTREPSAHEIAVDAILRDAGITYTATHTGVSSRGHDGKKPHDRDDWVCTFEGKKKANFEFHTGMGLRAFPAALLRNNDIPLDPKKHGKPVAPHPASVLHSIISDGDAITMSFEDWCAEFGYDTDSRKALATYEACQKNMNSLQRVIGDLLVRIDEALQDY
jgi:hypothetical protein